MMYDELVKDLRENHDKYFARDMEAADVIEELSKKRESACWGCKCEKIEQASWIPVSERLPEEKDSGFSADVLILVKEQDGDFTWEDVYSGYYLYDAVSDETGWWAQMPQNCQQVKERFSVTHWMPLPEPPEDGE